MQTLLIIRDIRKKKVLQTVKIIDNMVYMPYSKYRKRQKISMNKFIIEFYEKENGDIPAEEFLLGLNIKMRAKLSGLIEILQEKGN